MISIVISTYRKDYLSILKENIKETIGAIPYEIIEVFNPGKMGISKAYNHGAASAAFENLLFIHEDMKFLSQNWGEELLKSFELPNVGILGLAGNQKKTFLPTGHDIGLDKYRKVFIYHSEKPENDSSLKEAIPVKTLDGVFLAMKKRLWQRLKFDEEIEGFHFYDMDISLRSSLEFQNYVLPAIKVIHFSMGNFGDEWIKSCIEFHKRNRQYNLDDISKEEKMSIRKFWYRRLMAENISFHNRLKFINKMGVDGSSISNVVKFLFNKRLLLNN